MTQVLDDLSTILEPVINALGGADAWYPDPGGFFATKFAVQYAVCIPSLLGLIFTAIVLYRQDASILVAALFTGASPEEIRNEKINLFGFYLALSAGVAHVIGLWIGKIYPIGPLVYVHAAGNLVRAGFFLRTAQDPEKLAMLGYTDGGDAVRNAAISPIVVATIMSALMLKTANDSDYLTMVAEMPSPTTTGMGFYVCWFLSYVQLAVSVWQLMVPSTSAVTQALDKPQATKLSYIYSLTALNWVLNSGTLLLLSWVTPPAPLLLLLISIGALLMTAVMRKGE